MIEALQSKTIRVMLKLFEAGTVTAATGKTASVTLSKNGGAFANPSAGAVNATEVAEGWYYVDLSTTDTNTLGDLVVRGTATGCDPSERLFTIVKSTNRGMSGIPDAAADAAGGLPVSIAGGLDLDTYLTRLDVAVTTRLAALSYTAPLSASDIRSAVGMSSSNLDTQLSSLSSAVSTAQSDLDIITGADGVKIASGTQTFNMTGNITGTLSTVTTLTGHTPQTGDSYARLGDTGGPTIASIINSTASDVTTGFSNTLTAVGNVPTVAEFEARTLVSSNYATSAGLSTVASYLDTEIAAILADTNELRTDWADGGRLDTILDARASQTSVDTGFNSVLIDTGTAIPATLAGMAGAGFNTATDSLEAIRDRGDVAWLTGGGGGGGGPTALEIADAVWDELTSTHVTVGTFGAQVKTVIDNILSDTNELQTDWVDGGRLDVILDAKASQVSIDNLNDFNPATDTVARVTLVDTTTTNTDMRGTNSAYTGTPPSSVSIAAAVRTELATELGRIDVEVSSRLPTSGYTAPLTSVDIRSAVGLSSANLDTQLSSLSANTTALQTDWANGGRLDVILDSITTNTVAVLANQVTIGNDTGTVIPSLIGALNNISASDVLNVFKTWALFTGYNWETLQKEIAAALLGDVSNSGTIYKSPITGESILTVAADNVGNRTVTRS